MYCQPYMVLGCDIHSSAYSMGRSRASYTYVFFSVWFVPSVQFQHLTQISGWNLSFKKLQKSAITLSYIGMHFDDLISSFAWIMVASLNFFVLCVKLLFKNYMMLQTFVSIIFLLQLITLEFSIHNFYFSEALGFSWYLICNS